MRSLFRFIERFHFILLFLIFETVALFLAINSHNRKKAIVLNSASTVTSFVYNQMYKYRNYFSLRQENEKLLRDNIELKNQIESSFKFDTSIFRLIHDTVLIQQYSYMPAKVIKNSIFEKNNYLTINKGSDQGVEADMAVINPDGAIGIITNVSNNFSVAISLLNSKIGISAKIKKNGYYGSIVWEAGDYTKAILKEIPNHVEIDTGDTIVTSGYSAIFPEGIMIGIIGDFEKNSQDNFYTISVKLSPDFKNVNNVYLIKNLIRTEQLQLEEEAVKLLEN